MDINKEIETALIGAKFKEEQIACTLSEIVGAYASCYDTKIDDGSDDDDSENEYIMKSCFEFYNSTFEVLVYYGNNTREIGYVAFRE